MIVEVCKYKHTPKFGEKRNDILDQYRVLFVFNENRWFSSDELTKQLAVNQHRSYINKLRCEGLPIISHIHKGYKLTTNKIEIKQCYSELRNRALKALTSARLMKKII